MALALALAWALALTVPVGGLSPTRSATLVTGGGGTRTSASMNLTPAMRQQTSYTAGTSRGLANSITVPPAPTGAAMYRISLRVTVPPKEFHLPLFVQQMDLEVEGCALCTSLKCEC